MSKALLLIDIQNDFLPGGALAVPEGNTIIDVVNELQQKFNLVIATQDYHPADHGSFAANHPGKKVGEVITLEGLTQILWPVHCVENTEGAAFARSLDVSRLNKVFKKGRDRLVDSYSGFFDNGKLKSTGLDDYLVKAGVDEVYIAGLATDYCVKFTAIDAFELGFQTYVIDDATRAVNLMPGDFEKSLQEMKDLGIQIIKSAELK